MRETFEARLEKEAVRPTLTAPPEPHPIHSVDELKSIAAKLWIFLTNYSMKSRGRLL